MQTEQKKYNLLPLKYTGYAITFSEVPEETSLTISISGCPHHCEGCHSRYLWEYTGRGLAEDLDNIVLPNFDFITCVCFMGGDQNLPELKALCEKIRKQYGLKTCIYSGLDDLSPFLKFNNLNYLKIGSYKKDKGGLDNKNTNQKMYKINQNKDFEDITYKFFAERN